MGVRLQGTLVSATYLAKTHYCRRNFSLKIFWNFKSIYFQSYQDELNIWWLANNLNILKFEFFVSFHIGNFMWSFVIIFGLIYCPMLSVFCWTWLFQNDAEKMYNMLKSPQLSMHCGSSLVRCGLCGVTEKSFKILSKESEIVEGRPVFTEGLRGEKVTSFTLLLIVILELPNYFYASQP